MKTSATGMLLLDLVKFLTTVHKVPDIFTNPLSSPVELSMSSRHLRQHRTAGYLIIM